MASNVESMVLEQLKPIRSELENMRGDMADMNRTLSDKIDDLQTGQQALQGVVMGLGHYMNNIDTRVEHIEEKLGIE